MKAIIASQRSFLNSDPLSGIFCYLNPLRMLRAQQQLSQFRALTPEAQRDIGITQRDVDNATLSDFLNAPSR
jgi:hypothetical protein